MMEEIRTVKIGGTTIEVEVDPDDFKTPGLAWIGVGSLSLPMLALGHVYIALALLACSALLRVALHFRRKAAMEMAIREAAQKGYWGYERSRMLAYKSLG